MKVLLGDTTKLSMDCIVNPANESLLAGGGVGGAIHNAITKTNVLQGLKNIKIVLGNGFDLSIGMKTSYKDYFFQDEGIEIIKQYLTVTSDRNLIINCFLYNCRDIDELYKLLSKRKTTIWHLYFCYKKARNECWYEIENLILGSFKGFNCFWEQVFQCQKSVYENRDIISPITVSHQFALYIKLLRQNYYFENRDLFYLYLLEELNKFEAMFCEYVKGELDRVGYNSASYRLLKILAGRNLKICHDVSIDTFNYTKPAIDGIPVYNINGGLNNAIFGIDKAPIDNNDITSIFRKTYRRFKNAMQTQTASENIKFDNVIIFGHSLNEQDYSYFFPMFDTLNISSPDFMGKIVFAYTTKYDSANKEIIEHKHRMSVMNMLSKYEQEHLGKSNNRLLDNLDYKKNILFYCIDD